MRLNLERLSRITATLGGVGVTLLVVACHIAPPLARMLGAMAGGIGAVAVLVRFGPDLALGVIPPHPRQSRAVGENSHSSGAASRANSRHQTIPKGLCHE